VPDRTDKPTIGDPTALSVVVPTTTYERDRYFDLRWRVLREPWQQPRGSERDDREDGSIHLMIRATNGDALAVGRLHLNSPVEAQVRFMAVDPRWQGRGLGSTVLRELERRARAAGATSVVLNAREPAQRFYDRHGYRVEGPADTLFSGMVHVRMRKQL
jgi:ribosomal protein S18 acetylase RimI-like enzyme